MTKNNVPLLQQVDSGPNNELSFTGDDHTQSTTPKHTGSTEHPAVMDAPEAATREGSEKNPILLDSTPEELSPVRQQPRPSRPRRNVGPPKFFGERRYIDIVLEKEDTTTEVITLQDDKPNSPRATFTVTSTSDFLTQLAEVPSKTTHVAETTLSWSSQKSIPSGRVRHTPIHTILKNTSFGSSSPSRPKIDATSEDLEETSDVLSTIDPEIKHIQDDFDAKLH